MRVSSNDSGSAGDLHDLGDIFGLNPDLDGMRLEFRLGQPGDLNAETLWTQLREGKCCELACKFTRHSESPSKLLGSQTGLLRRVL
jgi:hypothetical protein